MLSCLILNIKLIQSTCIHIYIHTYIYLFNSAYTVLHISTIRPLDIFDQSVIRHFFCFVSGNECDSTIVV